jgi:shikimate dehydrogenase
VLDAVYQPLETVLLAVARESGARCVDGLSMLVHQAVEQQRLWTGNTPDSTVMRRAADLELARRREMRRE